MYRESYWRSLFKAVSWRLTGTLATCLIVFLFTRKIDLAVNIGLLEFMAKTALYYFHERGWDKIRLGRSSVKPFVLWFTGLPASGKTTLAKEVAETLKARGLKVEFLDGDLIRDIFPLTGFSRSERDQHIRRVGYLASKLEAQGVCVVASLVSPYRESREFTKGLCKNFIEVFVSTPLEECERRDPKGLYKKARLGEVLSFTGISDPYEPPQAPAMTIDTSRTPLAESIDRILNQLKPQLASV